LRHSRDSAFKARERQTSGWVQEPLPITLPTRATPAPTLPQRPLECQHSPSTTALSCPWSVSLPLPTITSTWHPQLGYGTGTARARKIEGDSTTLDPALVSTILTAIRAGYRHLDGAESYNNEAELGEAIKQSGLPRSAFYVTTKILGTRPTDTEASFAASLKKLKLDYVDLYLIHAPFFTTSDEGLQAKWADLEKIKASGRAKSIGVSNFLQPHLEAVLKTAKVVPAVNQIEYHPYLQHGDLLAFHQKHGIATVAYSPLSAVVFGKPGPLDQYYANLATKYGVQEAEVALRWCLEQGVVALTTSANEERLKTYLENIGRWELTEKEVQNIKEIGGEKHLRRFWLNNFQPDDRSWA
jgi:diketogulonate reductase-like aldo/keto reductase